MISINQSIKHLSQAHKTYTKQISTLSQELRCEICHGILNACTNTVSLLKSKEEFVQSFIVIRQIYMSIMVHTASLCPLDSTETPGL